MEPIALTKLLKFSLHKGSEIHFVYTLINPVWMKYTVANKKMWNTQSNKKYFLILKKIRLNSHPN